MEPAADHATSHPPRPGASRARAILLRMSIVALVGGVILVLMGRSGKTQTVSHVIREIHKIVLSKPDGGFIGPWWVSAAGLDPITGELKAMKVEFGAIHMASKTARVVVNPDTDSFKFEMWDVVLIRVPPSSTRQPDEDGEMAGTTPSSTWIVTCWGRSPTAPTSSPTRATGRGAPCGPCAATGNRLFVSRRRAGPR